MNGLLNVSSNPHIRSNITTSSIMLLVVISLLPAAGFGVFHFGLNALLLLFVSIIGCVLFELLFNLLCKKKTTIGDLSAVVTGLLLGMNLPPRAPWWIALVGSFFAIVIVKMLFGGIGQNFMNPALGARCFLMISFTSIMTNFNIDSYTGPTPLRIMKDGGTVDIIDMLKGYTAGTIGETSAIALLIGAAFLVVCGVIDLVIPATYLFSFAIFMGLMGGHGFDVTYICAQLVGGGLILGAFFMATDYVTRPVTYKGQFIYGIILGFLTCILRVFSPMAEGVSYAIIISNLLVPLIDKFTKPSFFGKGAA